MCIVKLYHVFANACSFLNLAQHRFASHCCETLFLQAAPIATQELTAPLGEQQSTTEDGEVYVSMENLFLYTLNELEGNLGYLMTDPFASHTLRVLLVVLSGKPLADANTASLLQSKKKENISKTVRNSNSAETRDSSRVVPDSFQIALDKMISDTIIQLDTTYLRSLACHPVGNPVLQLLLELELSRSGKQKAKEEDSLFRKLLPDDPSEEGTETASFVNHLLYDPVGSRLLEVIVRFSPGKTFKALYRSLFQDRLGTIAKNETAGFVVIKILERLNKEDLQQAAEQLCPQIRLLIERQRTSVIKVLIERCRIRQVDTASISQALVEAYGEEPSERLSKMLRLNMVNTDGMAEDRKKQLEILDSGKVHGSLLAQCMLEVPDTLRELITEGLLAMDVPALLTLSKDRTGSRVLQNALICSDQNIKFRRVLIQRFLGHMAELASDTIASHVIDSFWVATNGLFFIRERLAAELLSSESILRESIPGRAVWRNWKMDIYKTKKYQWISDAKEKDGAPKTGLELARERFAKGGRSKDGSSKRNITISTGANGILVQGKV